MNKCQILDNILESEPKFWKDVYKSGEAHWTDKDPSRLVLSTIKKYGPFTNVLEIGSAAGIDTFELAKNADSVIGIDIVPDAIKLSIKNLKDQTIAIQKKIVFETGDAENLKYKDGQFDLVYSLSVLHSTDVSKSLSEVHRVLSDKGHAVIYVFIGGKEGIDKDKYLSEVNKYFNIDSKNEVDVKKDEGGDKHKALITFLSRSK